MKDKIDWCKFFAEIEKNPSAITPNITVRQLYEAKEHVQNCNACFNRTERVLAKSPPISFPKREKN